VPIYEFYCCDCHTVFNFFARRVNTTKRPKCPRCGRPKLERKISRFAVSRGSKTKDADKGPEEGGPEDLPPGFDEAKFEQAMEQLAREADGLDEEDPRQAARMMRKLYESTGMKLSDRMEEAIRRMESGEDPDRIEEEMGDLLDEEEPMFGGEDAGSKLKGLARKLRPPQVDDTLYELD
jgi:putative FmdB family regulatory protein